MTGRFLRLTIVCAAAIALGGCLSINVDKTEKTSAKTTAPSESRPSASLAEPAD